MHPILTIYQPRYGALIVAAAGGFSCIPPLIGFLSSNLFSTAAAGLAIAINVSVGAPGQIAGVWIYKPEEAAKGYPTGHVSTFILRVIGNDNTWIVLIFPNSGQMLDFYSLFSQGQWR